MNSPDIPNLLPCIPGQDHTPAPVRDGISSYAKRHFIMPGSKGLNTYAVAGSTRDRNVCVLLSFGAVKISSGFPSSTT